MVKYVDPVPGILRGQDYVQMLAFTVETMYFYAANPEKPSDKVADTLKLALSMILVHYDFLAGRVRLNEELKRMEIDRNDAGAQFATASCDLTLAELGDLSVPNALFRYTHVLYTAL